jgi:hypothetical protein
MPHVSIECHTSVDLSVESTVGSSTACEIRFIREPRLRLIRVIIRQMQAAWSDRCRLMTQLLTPVHGHASLSSRAGRECRCSCGTARAAGESTIFESLQSARDVTSFLLVPEMNVHLHTHAHDAATDFDWMKWDFEVSRRRNENEDFAEKAYRALSDETNKQTRELGRMMRERSERRHRASCGAE